MIFSRRAVKSAVLAEMLKENSENHRKHYTVTVHDIVTLLDKMLHQFGLLICTVSGTELLQLVESYL